MHSQGLQIGNIQREDNGFKFALTNAGLSEIIVNRLYLQLTEIGHYHAAPFKAGYIGAVYRTVETEYEIELSVLHDQYDLPPLTPDDAENAFVYREGGDSDLFGVDIPLSSGCSYQIRVCADYYETRTQMQGHVETDELKFFGKDCDIRDDSVTPEHQRYNKDLRIGVYKIVLAKPHLLISLLGSFDRSLLASMEADLLSLLQSPIPTFRKKALMALGYLGLEKYLPHIAPLLNDHDSRETALEVLKKIGGERALEMLLKYLSERIQSGFRSSPDFDRSILATIAQTGCVDELKFLQKYSDSLDAYSLSITNEKDTFWRDTHWGEVRPLKESLLDAMESIRSRPSRSTREKSMGSPRHTDAVILTVLPEEYRAVCNKIKDLRLAPQLPDQANLYAWAIGTIPCNNSAYSIAVGMMGRAGTIESALATANGIDRWHPRYILFVGIAGGFADLEKGDVIIADAIYGYNYGKLDRKFIPRANWTYKTDIGLLNGAMGRSHGDWWKWISNDWRDLGPASGDYYGCPHFTSGDIASGDQIVDDPTNEFFAEVLKKWPKIKAVEMEGAGVGNAIENAQALGKPVGFLMIRGISDLPRSSEPESTEDKIRGTQERDGWKKIAAENAAAFAISLISGGLPLPPSK